MSRALIWHSLAEVPADLGGTVVAIGNFDGVHLGHRAVLEQACRVAAERGLAPVALTFWPHPRHVCVTPGEPRLVTDYEERDRLLLLSGLRGVLDLEFTLAFAQHSPEDFVRIFLVEGLGMRCIVMGADSRFGKDNAGDLATMRELGAQMGFDVLTLEDLGPAPVAGLDAGASDRFSSSAVRRALDEGDVAAVTAMLGRHHTVSDVVHHGFKRGRELGFPTANLGPAPRGFVPADGVYAGYLTVIDHAPGHEDAPPLVGAPATISIGTNPTFHASGAEAPPRIVEAYVHTDRDLDLYGDTVRIEFVDRQRPTLRFDGIEPLVAQMRLDLDVTRRTLDADPLGSLPRDW